MLIGKGAWSLISRKGNQTSPPAERLLVVQTKGRDSMQCQECSQDRKPSSSHHTYIMTPHRTETRGTCSASPVIRTHSCPYALRSSVTCRIGVDRWTTAIPVSSCLTQQFFGNDTAYFWESCKHLSPHSSLFCCQQSPPRPQQLSADHVLTAEWDLPPLKMSVCLYAVLSKGPSVTQWRCSNETKKGAFCYTFAERKVTHLVAGVGNWNAQHISAFKEKPTLIPLQFYLFISSDGRECKRKDSASQGASWVWFLQTNSLILQT